MSTTAPHEDWAPDIIVAATIATATMEVGPRIIKDIAPRRRTDLRHQMVHLLHHPRIMSQHQGPQKIRSHTSNI